MPLYEYLCASCGHRFERIQKFSDPLLTECPACGGKVEKQISSPAIQFKGQGWYVTDYAKSGKESSKSDSAMKTPSTPTSPSESGSSQKTDAPAASEASKPAAAQATPAKADTK